MPIGLQPSPQSAGVGGGCLHTADSLGWPLPRLRSCRAYASSGLRRQEMVAGNVANREAHEIGGLKAAAVGGRTLGEVLLEGSQFAWEREKSKGMVIQFLKDRGVSTVTARQTVNRSPVFLGHLLSLLFCNFQTQIRAGRELTAHEITSTLQPYLESLALKYREGLIDVFLSFPDPPRSRKASNGTPVSGEDASDLRDQFMNYPHLLSNIVDGELRPPLLYLLSLGLSESQVETIVRRFPAIVSYSVKGKLKPMVDLILAMGVPASDIPKVVVKRPQLLGCSVADNMKPTMAYLESLGVEKEHWPRMLVKFPHVITFSQSKLQGLVTFLSELGIAPPLLGRLLSRFPCLTGYSVEAKLRPITAYFRELGITDVGGLVLRSPQVFGLSLEENIKPTVEFLLSLGLTEQDVATILPRFPQLLGLNVPNNLRLKAEFLAEVGRDSSEVVDFPQYFGYSLTKRIKPRLEAVAASGIPWTLNRTLTTADSVFKATMEKEKRSLSIRTGSVHLLQNGPK